MGRGKQAEDKSETRAWKYELAGGLAVKVDIRVLW